MNPGAGITGACSWEPREIVTSSIYPSYDDALNSSTRARLAKQRQKTMHCSDSFGDAVCASGVRGCLSDRNIFDCRYTACRTKSLLSITCSASLRLMGADAAILAPCRSQLSAHALVPFEPGARDV